jgi:SAM-dependent methyltransferase
MYDDQSQENIKYIGSQIFDVLRDQSVLELGPFDGWFTKEILTYTDRVTCVELSRSACRVLCETFGNSITVVEEDFHTAMKTVGKFDAVVVFGVLYHSPGPLLVLEDIANFVKPTYILLECWSTNPTGVHVDFDEIANTPGNRFAGAQDCGISLVLGKDILLTALSNLGYTKERDFTTPIGGPNGKSYMLLTRIS